MQSSYDARSGARAPMFPTSSALCRGLEGRAGPSAFGEPAVLQVSATPCLFSNAAPGEGVLPALAISGAGRLSSEAPFINYEGRHMWVRTGEFGVPGIFRNLASSLIWDFPPLAPLPPFPPLSTPRRASDSATASAESP